MYDALPLGVLRFKKNRTSFGGVSRRRNTNCISKEVPNVAAESEESFIGRIFGSLEISQAFSSLCAESRKHTFGRGFVRSACLILGFAGLRLGGLDFGYLQHIV